MSFFDDASLVFLPSGQAGKDGKAYSMKPTNGDGDFTFSRGSNLTATRVDSNGLIAKGRENLLLQSNQFDTTWLTANASVTSGQSGYDGSTDAWLITKTTTSSGRVQQNKTSSGVQTFSAYAKKGTLDGVILRVDSTSGNQEVIYNLTSGSVGSITGGVIDSSITSVGNDWYKIQFTFNTSITAVRIYPSTNTGGITTIGNIYIQDAQLEVGLVATEYIESGATTGLAGILEDSPRFDYSGGASCPALLLEPSRTQIVRQSEYIDGYSGKVQCTTTPNYGTSPEGLVNSTRLEFTANGYIHEGVSQVSGTEYTISVYAKRNDSGTQSFGFFVNGSGTIDSAITLTSEWKRFDYTYTASNSSFFGFAGNSGADVSVFGLQVEEGSYPTSYIPNHSGGSVTREADAPSNTSAASIIGQTEGTIFIDFLYESNPAGNRFSISDGTATNWIFIATPESGTSSRFYIRVNNSVIVDVGSSSYFVDGTRYKLALAYKSRDWAVYGNGTQLYVGTDNIPSFSSPMDTINFKSFNPSDAVTEKEKINQVLLFDTRISNGNLATLTS